MAAKFDETAIRGTVYEFFPEQIEIRRELNGRHDLPEVESLIQSLMTLGQIQPVLIWNDGGTPVLASGFSRWRAVSEINKRNLLGDKVRLKCIYIKANENDSFLRNIAENRFRNPVTALDDAYNIKRLSDVYNKTIEEIAAVYFPLARTPDELKEALVFVKDRQALISLTAEAEKAFIDGRLDLPAAKALAKLTSAQQKAQLKARPDGTISRADLKGPRAIKPPKLETITQELMRRITAVIESADFENYDEKETDYIQVIADKLVALKNYVEKLQVAGA